MVTCVSGGNFSSTFSSNRVRKAASTCTSPTMMEATRAPWPTVRVTFSKPTALSRACWSPSKVEARESSLYPERETRRAGRVSSTWTPFLPLAGKRNSSFASRPSDVARARSNTSASPIAIGAS